jgi:hypothetical protein
MGKGKGKTFMLFVSQNNGNCVSKKVVKGDLCSVWRILHASCSRTSSPFNVTNRSSLPCCKMSYSLSNFLNLHPLASWIR